GRAGVGAFSGDPFATHSTVPRRKPVIKTPQYLQSRNRSTYSHRFADPDIPHPRYCSAPAVSCPTTSRPSRIPRMVALPRPDLKRQHWLSLNGPWQFVFDLGFVGEQERWHRPGSRRPKDLTITLPFPWESRHLGVAAPGYKGAAWYEREITIPAKWD